MNYGLDQDMKHTGPLMHFVFVLLVDIDHMRRLHVMVKTFFAKRVEALSDISRLSHKRFFASGALLLLNARIGRLE